MPRSGAPRPNDRPHTGSSLFPNLVWAHWQWQTRFRPYSFPRKPRWARPVLALKHRLNGWPPQNGANGEPASEPTADELDKLKKAYEDAAAEFEKAEGKIIREYWCATEASAVVVTEKRKGLSWLPWIQVGDLRLHRVTDWVTADAPKVAELLHGGDMLAVRVNRVLHAVPRFIAMEWIFSEQSYLLGLVERSGGHLTWRQSQKAIERHQDEVKRLELYYHRAGLKAARIWYFGGMLAGLLAVAALGVVIPFAIRQFATFELTSDEARGFYASFVAGALGAVVSVMTRMRDEKGEKLKLDYEVGELLIVMLGAFRPVLGAIFGVLTYLAIESKVLPLDPPVGEEVFYYAVFAFAAGFSERFAHVITGSADLAASKALADVDGGEPPRTSATADVPTAAQNGQAKAAKPTAPTPP
jgi:hypothetical protein